MRSLPECNTKLCKCNTKQLRIRKGFSYRLALVLPQLLNKLCVVLSVFAYFHAKVFQILRKIAHGH